jgi:SAM-dependent methyltransferase
MPPEPDDTERELHSQVQSTYFDKHFDFFCRDVPESIQERTRKIVQETNLNANSKVLDVGTGTGALIKHFLESGISQRNIIGCDLSREMIDKARKRYPDVYYWRGDILDFPLAFPEDAADHIKAVDAIFFNACFGNVWNQEQTLVHSRKLLAPGGKIVISNPMGKKFVAALNVSEPELVPHLLPDLKQLQEWSLLVDGMVIDRFIDEPDLYLAILRAEQ